MATMNPDIAEDTSPVYDDEVLAHELRQALKSDGEIELFKVINRSLRVKDELANTETIRTLLQFFWQNVADFFDEIVEIDSIAHLEHTHPLVVKHKDMQAHFRAVASINAVFKDAETAEEQLIANDQMDREQELANE